MNTRPLPEVPPEIWMRILAHLDPASLLTCAALVCHDFYSAATTDTIMNEKSFKHFGIFNKNKSDGLSFFIRNYSAHYAKYNKSKEQIERFSAEECNWLSLIKEADIDFIELKLKKNILQIDTLLPFIQSFSENCIFNWIRPNQSLRNFLFTKIYSHLTAQGTSPDNSYNGFSLLHYIGMLGPSHQCAQELTNSLDLAMPVRDQNGKTAIYHAIERGLVETCSFFVNRGVSLDDPVNNNQVTPFFLATIKNQPHIIRLLHEHSIKDVDQPRFKGASALCIASEHGCIEAAECLLELKANPNFLAENGATPLFLAAFGGHPLIVKSLYEHHANINANTYKNITPLDIAFRKKHELTSLLLLELGADFSNIKNKSELLFWAIKRNFPHIVRKLLNSGIDPNILYNGVPPIYAAVELCHEEILDILLEFGANPNLSFKDVTPLFLAATLNRIKTVKKLLQSKADPNAFITTQNSKETPLLVSAVHGYLDILKELLENGASLGISNPHSLYAAAANSQLEIVSEIMINVDLYKLYGKRETKIKLDEKSLLAAVDKALYIAAKNGNIKLLNILFDNNAAIRGPAIADGNHPLYTAATNNHFEIIKVLVKRGEVEPNMLFEHMETALHIAAMRGNLESLKVLLELGANIRACMFAGQTALHYAALSRHLDVVNFLVQTDPELLVIKDFNNETPLEFLLRLEIDENRKIIIKFLQEAEAKLPTSNQKHALSMNKQ